MYDQAKTDLRMKESHVSILYAVLPIGSDDVQLVFRWAAAHAPHRQLYRLPSRVEYSFWQTLEDSSRGSAKMCMARLLRIHLPVEVNT